MKRTKGRKNKNKISFLILIIAVIIIIGSSLAFFSDFILNAMSATAGTVKLKETTLYIEQDATGDDSDMAATNVLNWNPGDVTTIKWTVENEGNKSVHTKNTLSIAWDVATDIPEENSVYIYPYHMTDDEIRDDIINNSAERAISIGDDNVELTTPTHATQGFEHSIIGDILDGTGVIEPETGDAIEKNLGAQYALDDDGETTKDILKMKLAFSPFATNEYQGKPAYINLTVEAVQYRNNALGFYANAEEAMGTVVYTGQLSMNTEATYKLYENKTLVIEGTGAINAYDFDTLLYEQVNSADEINRVIIKDGITMVGSGAFDAINLTSITFPNTLEIIDDYAFNGHSFTELIIPEGVTYLGTEAFVYCNNLTTLHIPSTITYMGIETFAWCRNLKNVTLAEGLTFIGDGMFEDCDALTSITLPSTIKYIDEWAFYGSNNLTNINFPNGLEEIRYIAFGGCTSLIVPDMPNSLKSIGISSFSDCKPIETLVLKEGLTTIGDNAFPNITNLTIPSTVENWGWEPFGNVQNLTISGSYPDTIASFLPNISTVTIQAGSTFINDSLLADLTSLTQVTIPDGVTTIGMNALAGCTNLKAVSLPSTLVTIGYGAFYGNNKIQTINFLEGLDSIEDDVFYGCTGLTGTITIPSTVTYIGEFSFGECLDITTINVNQPADSIDFAPWGATNATVNWQ